MASESRYLFVTGTDTGVGKTLVSAALIRNLRKVHRRVCGMKPVATGLIWQDKNWVSTDVLALKRASNVAAPQTFVNPFAFERPVAPHLAARAAGSSITLESLVRPALQLGEFSDVVVIEGAGGWRVPINDEETLADLANALDASVVLVVGLKLGCLNHAILASEAIKFDGLSLAGWVANSLYPGMELLEENIASLKARIPGPFLGHVPYLMPPTPEDVRIESPRI
jgi:dethiobiotin synthetase